MDFQDLKDQFYDLIQRTSYFINKAGSVVQKYFKSLDRWEWVGWGGEAAGLTLVITSIILW